MDLRKIKDRATEAFARGKFAKAAELYEEYCKGDPKDLQARLRMGDAFAKSGQKEKAVLAYKSAAEGYAREGFLPRAIAASKLILEIDPMHQGVQQMLADLYARKSAPGGGDGRRSAGSRPPETSADASASALDWSKRRDAIELPPVDVPSPTNRKDAIELSPDAPPGPAEQAVPIEIEPGQAADGAVELEIPIEAAPKELSLETARARPVDLSAELPPELQIERPTQSASNAMAGRSPPPGTSRPGAPSSGTLAARSAITSAADIGGVRPEAVPVDASDAAEARTGAPGAPSAAGGRVGAAALAGAAATPTGSGAAPPDAAPPGLKPKRHADGAPPERMSSEPARAGESIERWTRPQPEPPAAAQRPTSRIWIPPAFPGAPQNPPAQAPKETLSDSHQVPRGLRTDLERGLAAFSRFDELEIDLEKAAALAPLETGGAGRAPEEPPKRRVPSFIELELEGDSLLHAVETAALAGAAQRGQQMPEPGEESLEAPEEPGERPTGELPKIPLFSDLPADAFIALFEQCPLLRFKSGERVIEQGTLGDSFFVICQGSVRVYRYESGAKRQLAILPEGSFFGEMALLSGEPRSASVEAAEDETQLLEISAPILQQLSLKYPTVAQALKKFCRQRMLSNVMASSALFKPFNRADRQQLVQRFRARDVPKNEVIIREGHDSDGLYVVLSGEVEVKKGQTRLAVLKEGDVFGEISLLTKSPATATVASLKRTSLLRLPREDFDLIISSHPQILELVSELTDDRRKRNELLMV